ncbi:lysozyme-like [Zophobas morio]|uniref:lysozyme-like n=1 Tax=Zophobas morio TaxID=2755281 RepID=UPI00308397C4
MATINSICLILLITGFGFIKCQNIVTSECLVCICEATTGCNFNYNCSSNAAICGPFRITRPYWKGAGSPTIKDESPNSVSAFSHCTSDLYCSIKTVQMFMKINERDCNGDGIIDCDDFAAIHQLGKYDCTRTLPYYYTTSYSQCRKMLLKYERVDQSNNYR